MIETARLIIRRFTPADLNSLAALRADKDVMRYIHTVPQTRDVVQKRIENFEVQYVERGFAQWAVDDKESNFLIGWCGFSYLDDKPPIIEIGYGFGKPHWGKGFASEAARACLRYGFENLNFERVAAVALHENSASRHVMEKCGLTYLRDSFHWGVDVVYYEIEQANFKPAAEPYKLLAAL